MIKIVLVRHGQTEWNSTGRYQGQSDVPLSAAGLEQADKLAAGFPLDHIDIIYSSDLSRARTTAEKVAARFGLEVHTDDAFRELSFGDWEGLTYDEIVRGWPDAMANFVRHPDRMDIPHGETFAAVQQRAMKRLNELVTAADMQGSTIAVFAHGAVIRTMLAAMLHIPLQYVWSIRQFNTAVNILTYEDGFYTIELMNSTAHLHESLPLGDWKK